MIIYLTSFHFYGKLFITVLVSLLISKNGNGNPLIKFPNKIL